MYDFQHYACNKRLPLYSSRNNMASFVSLGGPDDATRPTFFELIAAQRLIPSIKAALMYSVSVCAIQCQQ